MRETKGVCGAMSAWRQVEDEDLLIRLRNLTSGDRFIFIPDMNIYYHRYEIYVHRVSQSVIVIDMHYCVVLCRPCYSYNNISLCVLTYFAFYMYSL